MGRQGRGTDLIQVEGLENRCMQNHAACAVYNLQVNPQSPTLQAGRHVIIRIQVKQDLVPGSKHTAVLHQDFVVHGQLYIESLVIIGQSTIQEISPCTGNITRGIGRCQRHTVPVIELSVQLNMPEITTGTRKTKNEVEEGYRYQPDEARFFRKWEHGVIPERSVLIPVPNIEYS
jgi:hypothetical protein